MNAGPIGPEVTSPVHDDVRTIVSGNFNEDALGSGTYRAILARLAAAPQAYLEAFRTLVREWTNADQLASLHLPWFLTLLARTDPVAARETAAELLTAYQRVVHDVAAPALGAPRAAAETARSVKRVPPVTEHDKLIDRLGDRTAELQRILDS